MMQAGGCTSKPFRCEEACMGLYGLQISQPYINAVKNFKRAIWNPTVSLSGNGFFLQKSSSQQVWRPAEYSGQQDVPLPGFGNGLSSVLALMVSGVQLLYLESGAGSLEAADCWKALMAPQSSAKAFK